MNARQALKWGYGVFGTPLMKFTLTYDGSLPASANQAKNQAKWDIRLAFAPQLKDLWGSHPALRTVWEDRHYPKKGGATLTQVHHLHPGPATNHPRVLNAGGPIDLLDLCEPIDKHGAWFRPLVRESYALHCGLKVTFLRQEAPGKVYQAGDLDGRMKTLLDALAMPQHKEQILGKATKFDPIFCLLEDDNLISGLQIESERLLTDKSNPQDYVRLNIEVDVRVRQATIYNQSFLS
jgi:hypothetical protein